MLNVRAIELDDHKNFNSLLKQIESESFFMLFDPEERKSSDADQKLFLEKLSKSALSRIFVADKDNELVGFVFVSGEDINKKRHSRYLAMGLLKTHQGQKIGSALLREALEFCSASFAKRVELTVICVNQKAVSLYRKFGFDIEGVAKQSIHVQDEYVDQYYMAKLL